MKIIGEVDLHSGRPFLGKQGVCRGKIAGRRWHDFDVALYLDHDPIKGPHINVNDFRLGKGAKGIDLAIPFEGTRETVANLLKGLQR